MYGPVEGFDQFGVDHGIQDMGIELIIQSGQVGLKSGAFIFLRQPLKAVVADGGIAVAFKIGGGIEFVAVIPNREDGFGDQAFALSRIFDQLIGELAK